VLDASVVSYCGLPFAFDFDAVAGHHDQPTRFAFYSPTSDMLVIGSSEADFVRVPSDKVD
jgi:hypothetical protein